MSLFGIVVLLVAFAIIAAAISLVIIASRRANPGQAYSVISASGRIADIRALGTGAGSQQLVIFELDDGRRLELLATNSLASSVLLGQHGTVHWAGDRVTGWVPELGGPRDSHRSE